MPNMYERKPQQLTGGDTRELRVLYVDNGDGTWSQAVVVATLPLPSGAATAAKQDTTNIKLDDIIALLDPLKLYKYSDSATVSGNDYVGKMKADGAWVVTKYDSNGSATYKIGAAPGNDYVDGAEFGAWAAGLTGYDTYKDIF